MPKVHHYYEELLHTKYHNHLEMCDELGISLDDIYTDELTEEDLW